MAHVTKRLRDRARELRQWSTLSERRLWNWLRNRAMSGYKFRRQFPIAGCIVDFYCPELRLAIELDGGHHADPLMRDADDRRSARLAAHDVAVFRIENALLAKDSLTVELQLAATIRRRAAELKR